MSNESPIGGCASQCTLSEQWTDTTVVIGCAGVIDMATGPELERKIESALEKRPKSMIADLTLVTFLASYGMNALIDTYHLCADTIDFSVVADGPVTKRPMQLIGITDLLTVHATLNDALGAVAA